jgi:rhodanese-related sulfurtransferase
MPGQKFSKLGKEGRVTNVCIFVMALAAIGLTPACVQARAQAEPNIFQATLQELQQKTPEVSTDELKKLLAEKSAVVLDVRPYREYAVSHIPGAKNVAAQPGLPLSQHVPDLAELDRLLNNDKAAALVLYCDGPFCGKSKRVSAKLIEAGYTNVRRYQLGIPVWRALAGPAQTELDGVFYVLDNDRTAVFIDARDREEFAARTLPGSRNIPRSGVSSEKDSGEVRAAKDDGRLPMEDHNTRIIVFGRDAAQAQTVAEALAKEAFHNVAFYGGTFDSLMQRIAAK